MKVLHTIIFFIFSLSSYSASTACTLLNHRGATYVPERAIPKLRAKLKRECEIGEKFSFLKSEYQKLDLQVENIAIYKGYQFIHDWAFEMIGRRKNVAIPFIYQKVRNVPDDYIRTRLIWDNWALGYKALDSFEEEILMQNQPLDIEDVQEVHRGFYQLLTDAGETEYEARPGVFKNEGDYEDVPWWDVSDPKEQKRVKGVFHQINTQMAQWGFLPESEVYDRQGRNLNWLVKIENGKVYSVDPKMVRDHVDIWISFFNEYKDVLDDAYTKPIKRNRPILTPLEFATFMQKWFVSIHPFYDGNGRTSRFFQDLILDYFKLPALPSGLLSQDVDVSFEGYYEKSLQKLDVVLSRLETCLQEYQNFKQEISYDCRIVN